MGDLKFQLHHYAAELWRRKWGILLVACLVGLLGSFVAATRPDVFTSRAAVEVDDRSLIDVFLPKGVPRTNTEAAIDSVRRGIYARPNLEEIIRATDLHLTLEDQRGWESMVAKLEETLELTRQGPNFYVIEYTHDDPVKARDVTQAALDLFLEKGLSGVAGSEGPEGDATRRFLENQLADATARLNHVEKEIATYEREYGAEVAGAAPVASEKRGLENQLGQLQSDRLLYQQELSNLRARLAATAPEIVVRYEQQPAPIRAPIPPPSAQKVPIPSGPVPEEQRVFAFEQQVGDLQLEVQTMLERLTPQHPDVQTMQRRLQSAQADLANLVAAADQARSQLQLRIAEAQAHNARVDEEFRNWQIQNSQPTLQPPPKPIYGPNPVLADLRTQIDARQSRLTVVESQIAATQKDIARLQQTLARQPEILQTYNKLKNDQDKYASDVARLDQDIAKLALSTNPDTLKRVEFKIIEPPQVPVTPAGPNRLLLFFAAFLLAGGTGVGTGFLRTQLADNLPTLTHLKQSFDLPVLGGVSLIESKTEVARKAAGNLVFLASVAALITIFGYVTYRYHVELWRPDIGGLLSSSTGGLSARQ